VGGNVAGSVGSVTGAVGSVVGHTPQTGDSFARIGATGSGLTSLAPASTALSTAVWTPTKAGFIDAAISSVATGGVSAEDIADAILAALPEPTGLGEIADAVWDEARAGHTTAGTFGQGVASVQGNITGNVAGSVASVTAGVTVSDKTGYKLASDGVDAIVVESGINLRQSVAIIGASAAGKASGQDTTTAVFYAIGTSGTTTQRISAQVDAVGNRTATTLTVPA
jgi:hypothetical protein